MSQVTHLPQGAHNQKWQILAPAGGLMETVSRVQRAAHAQQSESFDLEIIRDDEPAWIRVVPDLTKFRQDDRYLSRYHVDGMAVFLDETRNETDNMVLVAAIIDTQATVPGSLTGNLVMWNPPEPSDEFSEMKEI